MAIKDLMRVIDAESHRSSSWDRTGGNVDCLTDLAPGHSAVLLDTAGPGKVTHIWLTVRAYEGHATMLRDMVIRMYWEGSTRPSVEVPLGDFFGLGHALPTTFYEKLRYTVTAEPVTVGVNERSMNCYWPMPFHRAARIEIYNNGHRSLRQLYFHVDYELGEQPADAALFHARFAQDTALRSQSWINLDGKDNFTLLETTGRGHYVGCFMYVDSDAGGWWGEGDDMIFIDHAKMPTINGTGTEDYFNNAWCYHHPFSYPNYGCPLLANRADGGTYTTMYRFHVVDPIRFKKHIRVSMEHVWGAAQSCSWATVAFWYQTDAVAGEPLPQAEQNFPRLHGEHHLPAISSGEINLPAMEQQLRDSGLTVRTSTVVGQNFLDGPGAIVIEAPSGGIALPIRVPANGRYRVEVKPIYALIQSSLQIGIAGGEPMKILPETLARENDGAIVSVGVATVTDEFVHLRLAGEPACGLQTVRIKRLD